MMYGKPNRVQYTNLYNLLMDNDRITRIHVPVVDESTQADGYNCGDFVLLSILEFFTVNSKKYLTRNNFVEDEGKFYLHVGDWFYLYRNHTDEENVDPTAPKKRLVDYAFKDFRKQMKVLWCRILALKKGVADITIYFTSTGIPKYVKTNFRLAV